MDGRKRTRGRQKIVIKKIERENDCYATFSKRRQGVFKKASELSTLCEADVGVFIFSPTGKPFSFFHPSMEAVLAGFGSDDVVQDDASRLLEACSRTRVLQLNQMIHRVGVKLDEEEEREKQLDDAMRENEEKWWEEPVENLGKEEVEDLIALLKNMQSKLSDQRRKVNAG